MAARYKVIIIGSAKDIKSLIPLLEEEDLDVTLATSYREAAISLKEREYDLAVIALDSEPRRYQEVVKLVRETDPQLSTLIVAKPEHGQKALEAVGGFSLGPLTRERLPWVVKRAATQTRSLKHHSKALSLDPLVKFAQTFKAIPKEDLAQEMLAEAGRIIAADQGMLFMTKGDEQQPIASWGFPKRLIEEGAYPRVLGRKAITSREILVISEGKAADPEVQRDLREWNIGPALSLPLWSRGDVIGSVCFVRVKGSPAFTEYEVRLAQVLAPLFSLILESEIYLHEKVSTIQEQLEWRRREVTALNELLQKQQAELLELDSNYRSLENRYLNGLKVLARTLDSLTARPGYSEEVARKLMSLAEHMGVSVTGLAEIAYLHDIALPQLPSEKVREHPILGEKMVREWGLSDEVARVIRHHHENYNGTGYPDGLSGEQIPELARLLRVVTMYVEWTLPHPELTHISEEEAISRLQNEAGKSLDPQAVQAFLKVLGKGETRSEAELLSTISHELRSPLTFLIGYSELLSSQENIPPEAREQAKEIYTEAIHLSKMVEDLLDLSRLESGKVRLNYEMVDLAELITHSVKKAATLSQKHRVVTNIPPSLPLVRADRDRIQQVLDNLLSNAINYSPDGGVITVKAEVMSDRVKVGVSDQGIGISPAELDRIFERFYRAETPLKYQIRGTGLGLSICKHIITSHGGEIWAESPGPGKGSTFFFTLPLFRSGNKERDLSNS